MALAPVAVPRYPDVPRAPGVPPVLRQIGAIENTAVLLVSDAVAIVRMFEGPQWGIFSADGQPVIIGDSVVAVDYRKEYRISDYPIEQGAFASYNKVQMPFDVRVVFAASGKQSLLASILSGGALGSLITGIDAAAAGRTAFLKAMDQAAAALYLFTVVTPEATYPSVNIVHYDYRREARRGTTLITVEVWCQEVRAASRATSSGTASIADPATPATPQNPASADPANGGTVQATPLGSGDTSTPSAAIDTGSNPDTVAVNVPIGSVPPGQVPLYDAGGNYVGHVLPGTSLAGHPGFTTGPLVH